MAQIVVRAALAVIVIFDLNSSAQSVGTDIHLESPQCSVVTKTLDVSFQQLTSPPECPAPSLEHALDQHHELDKTIPAMYDLPENFSSKEVYLVLKLKFAVDFIPLY